MALTDIILRSSGRNFRLTSFYSQQNHAKGGIVSYSGWLYFYSPDDVSDFYEDYFSYGDVWTMYLPDGAFKRIRFLQLKQQDPQENLPFMKKLFRDISIKAEWEEINS